MQTLWQDLRYGARRWLQKPSFTLVVLFTLALGIGANTAIFSVVNAVLLRPLPFHQADRLVMIWGNFLTLGMEQLGAKSAEYIDYREQNKVFDEVAAFTNTSLTLTGERPQRLSVARITANLFPLLGASASEGRLFSSDDEQPGNSHAVILSHALWQRNFGSDAHIVGKTIRLQERNYTIIGVMPQNFQFPHPSFPFAEPAELWLPLAFSKEEIIERLGRHDLKVIARLKPAVSLEQARADMSAIAARLEQQQPGYRGPNGEDGGWRITVIGLQEQVVGASRPALLVLLGIVGLILAIACANVANLLLAQATTRRKEIAIRTALGASRRRIFGQLLSESLMLALPAGALGLLLAQWGLALLLAFAPENIPRLTEVNLDWRVLVFTLALSLVTGIAFGLAPALQASKLDLNQRLKEGASFDGWRSRRTGNLLVTFEVAVALLVLVCAGLLVRSFARLQQINPGFESKNVLTAELSLPASKYTTPVQSAAFYEQLVSQVEALPGVQAAATGTLLPLGGVAIDDPFSMEGRPLDMSNPTVAGHQSISHGYFAALGIALLRGRDFTSEDVAGAMPVAIINQEMARAYWGDEEPIGKRIKLGAPRAAGDWRTVVGVVSNLAHRGIDSNARPDWYAPQAQMPARDMFLVVRSSVVDAASLGDAIREQVLTIDRHQPVISLRTLDEVIAFSVAPRRFNTLLAGLFAALALLLAVVGIYSVMLHSVNERWREIGIRLALGAQTSDVFRLVMRQGMTWTLLGVAFGLLLSIGLTRLMSSLLFGISATDLLTFAVVAAILTGVAMVACLVPARRAAKVDPMVALRYE
ncbi:MAG: ABC transporter permease [Acidobacteria bacterium]|nr:ABC transporter permease [Acidobacteriota bacterium]